ncbi:MAG TPA: AAA family ATPase [Candidatus Dormibacteraeota bacterium]|nr:AAA family ATPase [Candidatus Dormibacteraeota bacterium]
MRSDEPLGRDRELDQVDQFLASLPSGPAALALTGPAGIGKTTVWHEGMQRAVVRGYLTLSARPSEAEARLSYAAIADLLASIESEVLETLPSVQRHAIDVALLRAEAGSEGIDTRIVGTAFRSVLDRLATARPVVICVDDAQWLDAASAEALAFAVRRLDRIAVGVLVSVRVEGVRAQTIETSMPASRRHEVLLSPFNAAALHEILKRRLDTVFPRPTLIRILEASGGNPFYALEIGRELIAVGPPPPGHPLPVPPNHRDLALLRLRRLPRTTRDVLAKVSAMARPAADRLDLTALDPAETAGVVRILSTGQVQFTHPLFGSALYASLPGRIRRDLHRRLADIEVGHEQRARHLALAATEPDEETAAALDLAASEAGARGASEAAVELRELALGLTPRHDVAALVRRELDLASSRYLSGDASGARRDLERALGRLPAGEERAQVLLELGSVLWNQGEGEKGHAALRSALDEATTASLRARIHGRISSMTDDFDVAVEHAEAALSLIDEREDPLVYSFALHNMARAKLYSGRGADQAAIEKGMRLQREEAGWEVSTVPAYWARDFDDFDTARQRFKQTLRVLRQRGDEASMSGALAQLANIEALTGHLDEARELAAEALGLAEQTEQETWVNVALHSLAHAWVRSGDIDRARAIAESVLGRLEIHPDQAIEAMVRQVLGLAALSAQDYLGAVRHFARADEVINSYHAREPAPDRFHADYVESLISLGELDRAEDVVGRMEARARALPRPWILALGARSRGLLLSARGDLGGAVAAMLAALAHHESLDMPFERARTLLALGQVHRRKNERRAARAAFEKAVTLFEGLAVRPWIERARAELARVPVRRAAVGLTPSEENIARLVASGMTNKEAAERAFVSAKTVEANLARVYDKLGVHSRAELGRVMAERRAASKPPVVP